MKFLAAKNRKVIDPHRSLEQIIQAAAAEAAERQIHEMGRRPGAKINFFLDPRVRSQSTLSKNDAKLPRSCVPNRQCKSHSTIASNVFRLEVTTESVVPVRLDWNGLVYLEKSGFEVPSKEILKECEPFCAVLSSSLA